MKKRLVCVLLLLSVFLFSGCSVYSMGKSVTGTIEGTLTSGTFQSFGCNKVGNIVTVAARYYDLENEATNTVCFQLPEGFYPQVNVSCNGYIIVDGASIPVFLNIDTTGAVSLAYSKTKTMTQVYFSATFPAQ